MKTYSRHDFTREERAARAKVAISAAFESKEQAFLDFVLSHYVRVGVQELDQEKLTPLLRLKYNNSIADAVAPQERRIRDSRRGCHPADDGFSGRNRPNSRDESRL